MSELKRWDANRVSKEPAMLCHEYGPYVLIEDYVKLKAENERLRKLQEETAQDAYSWRELYKMLKAKWESVSKEGM